MAPYISFATTFSSIVDSSRFFSPVLSSLLVTYIYFVIGAHTKNSLWKLLYYVCNSGLVSNLFYTLRYIAKYLNMKPYNVILEWPEAIFFGFYEWGLVYLNFVKIRTCIKTLQIKFWKIFINLLFLFTMGFRLFTTYCSSANIKISFIDEDRTNAIIYTPIAILEIYFIILIIYTILNEDEDDKSRESLGILLNSSLTRMLFVSLILLSIAILTYIGSGDGFKLLAKRLLVKLKGAIGIIYLIDLLLIRIDLDNNTIKKQELQILKFCVKEKNHQDHNHNNYNGEDDEENESETFGFDPEDPYGLNKNPMDYMQHSKHSSVISKLPSNISTLHNTYNNGNIPRNSPISDYNNANIYRNSPISDYNNANIYLSSPTSDFNNANIYRNSPISDFNDNVNILKHSPISGYNKETTSLMPTQTNTPKVSNIRTSYLSAASFSSKKNSYKKLSNNYNSNKYDKHDKYDKDNNNNNDIKFSPTLSYTIPSV